MDNLFFYIILGLFLVYLFFMVRYWVIRKRSEKGEWKIDRFRAVFWATVISLAIGILSVVYNAWHTLKPEPEPTPPAAVAEIEEPATTEPVTIFTPIETITGSRVEPTLSALLGTIMFFMAIRFGQEILKAVKKLAESEKR